MADARFSGCTRGHVFEPNAIEDVLTGRQIVERGIYPAVDPLASFSRILDPRIVGQDHYNVARSVKMVLQRYKELQDIIAHSGS